MNDIIIIQILALYFLICALACSHQYWMEKEGAAWKKNKWYEKGFVIILVGLMVPILYPIAIFMVVWRNKQ